jgi:hypothetical protein
MASSRATLIGDQRKNTPTRSPPRDAIECLVGEFDGRLGGQNEVEVLGGVLDHCHLHAGRHGNAGLLQRGLRVGHKLRLERRIAPRARHVRATTLP